MEVYSELNLLLLLPLLLLLVEVYLERLLLLGTQLGEDCLDKHQSLLNRVHRQVSHHPVEGCLVLAQALPLPLLLHQQLEEGCFHSATNPLRPLLPRRQKLLRHHYSVPLPLLPLQLLRLQRHLRQPRLLVDFSVEGCLASQRRRRMSLQRLLLLYVVYVFNGLD